MARRRDIGQNALAATLQSSNHSTPWRQAMIETLSSGSPKVVGFKLSGKLHDADYKTFVPAIDAVLAKEGKVRLLAQFHDFQGWDMKALWDDIKFSTTHCTKIDRIALVGEKKWEEWMAKVCKPFTMAKIQYFDAAKIDDAWNWLKEGL
jgi:SpoIIAA-like